MLKKKSHGCYLQRKYQKGAKKRSQMAERFSQWPERQMVTGIEVDLKEIKKKIERTEKYAWKEELTGIECEI